jgi:hypothetical protein
MSDVNYDQSPAMMAARGQTYGKRKQQIDAQRAVPMGPSPTTIIESTKPVARPGSLTPLTAPTNRPNEPITAGADFGPGPTAMESGIPDEMSMNDDALRELKAIYSMYPSQDLADVIQFYEQSRM